MVLRGDLPSVFSRKQSPANAVHAICASSNAQSLLCQSGDARDSDSLSSAELAVNPNARAWLFS
jgi:hypothetical protein